MIKSKAKHMGRPALQVNLYGRKLTGNKTENNNFQEKRNTKYSKESSGPAV